MYNGIKLVGVGIVDYPGCVALMKLYIGKETTAESITTILDIKQILDEYTYACRFNQLALLAQ